MTHQLLIISVKQSKQNRPCQMDHMCFKIYQSAILIGRVHFSGGLMLLNPTTQSPFLYIIFIQRKHFIPCNYHNGGHSRNYTELNQGTSRHNCPLNRCTNYFTKKYLHSQLMGLQAFTTISSTNIQTDIAYTELYVFQTVSINVYQGTRTINRIQNHHHV